MEAATMSTVLIVEDDFAILFVAESTLRIEGYETVAAATRGDGGGLLTGGPKRLRQDHGRARQVLAYRLR
jgi:CheY-like chemotaxis protein